MAYGVLHPYELTSLSNDLTTVMKVVTVLHPYELTSLSNASVAFK